MELALLGMFGNGANNRVKIIWRLGWVCFSFFLMTFFCFALMYYSKGSVAFAQSNQAISKALRNQIEDNLKLNQPLLVQYQMWLTKMLQGDFSTSLVSGERVSSLLKEKLPLTLVLGCSAFFVLVLLSLLLGILSLYSKSLDYLISIFSIGFLSLPVFSLSLLLILFLSAIYPIFPSSGSSDIGMEGDFFSHLKHLVLPMSALVLSHLGVFTSFVRSTLFDALKQDFVTFGFARGLSCKRIYLHWVLKYALSPIVAFFSASMVSFIVGIYVVEGVFSYGGVGDLLIKSLIFKDYPVVLAILVLTFFGVLWVNFCSYCFCFFLDPRRKFE